MSFMDSSYNLTILQYPTFEVWLQTYLQFVSALGVIRNCTLLLKKIQYSLLLSRNFHQMHQVGGVLESSSLPLDNGHRYI